MSNVSDVRVDFGPWTLDKIGCGGRIRTFGDRINNPAPYQLGDATKNWLREQELNLPVLAYETSEPPLLYSRVKVGGDEGSRTLIDRFTRPTLCYPVELHRH
jgi:hypothetical protein